MAVTQSRDNRTINAGDDLSTSQFRFAKLDSTAEAVLTGLGEATIGVIEVGAKLGEPCTITHSGKVLVQCGATVTIGGEVTPDASGKAMMAFAGEVVVGYAYEAGSGGDIISIELDLGGNRKT